MDQTHALRQKVSGDPTNSEQENKCEIAEPTENASVMVGQEIS
jgi:hypothetical protein